MPVRRPEPGALGAGLLHIPREAAGAVAEMSPPTVQVDGAAPGKPLWIGYDPQTKKETRVHEPTPSPADPIGVFDSGVGGLSVLREIRHALPHEDLIYVADSGHAPYGDQPLEFIEGRASTVVRFLLAANVKAITIACNTATVVAVEKLRAWSPVPIVAIEPAIKPAAGSTKSGIIGVLATRQTLASPSVSRLCAVYGDKVQIHLQACPGLVEQVESADLAGEKSAELVRRYVAPLLDMGVDTLVLGCTHYPFLEPLIRAIAGPHVNIIDPAAAVARELTRQLTTRQLLATRARLGTESFYSSGSSAQAQNVIPRLWGGDLIVQELPLTGLQP